MYRTIATFILISSAALVGCVDKSPPPPRVAVPQDASEGPLRRSDPVKPMPRDIAQTQALQPAFEDPALIEQEAPERRAFVQAYNQVGRPLFIVEGLNQVDIAGASADRPVAMIFSDWLRSDGAVSITTGRGERSRPDVVIELSIVDGADRPAVNLSARAINVSDNVLLGQAIVDMPKPADRGAINRYTRFLARKLMNDMTRTWQNMPPAPAAAPMPAHPPAAAPVEPPPAPALPPPPPASPATNPA